MESRLLGAVSACIIALISIPAYSALITKLGGDVVYDNDRNITWLADANLAASNTFGVSMRPDGMMAWATAISWIDGMNAANYLGFNNWRLPFPTQPDVSCSNQYDVGTSYPLQGYGLGCTGSEMGHMFYDEFGAVEGTSVFDTGGPVELAKFTNFQPRYWYGTKRPPTFNFAWEFSFIVGTQHISEPGQTKYFAWAVHDGDIGAVPLPPALWLFGSGLLGLVGIARRNAT